jgi:hypothetical protein
MPETYAHLKLRIQLDKDYAVYGTAVFAETRYYTLCRDHEFEEMRTRVMKDEGLKPDGMKFYYAVYGKPRHIFVLN